MDLAALDIFRTTAAEQSVTRAATRLGRAPSNISTRIQQLESDLGVALFDRDGKRMGLTEQGRLFLTYAEQILGLAQEARQQLHPDSPSGRLRLGAMEAALASRLAAPLAAFASAWPDVALEISAAPSAPLLAALRANRVDCALVAAPPEGWGPMQDLDLCPLYREDLRLLLPPDHPPVQNAQDLRLDRLAAFAQGCSYRRYGEDWLHQAGRRAQVQEVGSYHLMYACTVAGSCLSVMPQSVAGLLGHLGPVNSLALGPVETCLASRKGYATAAFRAWRGQLLETACPAARPATRPANPRPLP
ncbi:LysR family transcriptional regulator (plasmid) [Thioclava litoralis]|uniref:LysR family transcriptional regulator n=1 Tax=Thioclava litoralis TaxID=3076557 RepID=A0ABZ1E5G3_9RHOB|nr:LysR family transcriptional regulator [Thioclava sp. FTW29]